jgi:predicted nucleotide-binding protein
MVLIMSLNENEKNYAIEILTELNNGISQVICASLEKIRKKEELNKDLGTLDNDINNKKGIIHNHQHSSKVFIVHGHDEAMKESVARTIEKLGLEAVILNERSDDGMTIIEKLTAYSDVDFAIALFSPDDMVYAKNDVHEIFKYRARQNVIFELGYFIGKIGRKRIILILKEEENFEMLSDYLGVAYTKYDKNKQWQIKLVQGLKSCGFNIDANKLW